MSGSLGRLRTPALLLDRGRLAGNLERMRVHTDRLGVGLRPHLKTAKAVEVARRAVGDAGPITVSTLAEAEHFSAAGFGDIVYAVGITPEKLFDVAAMRRRGARVQITIDSQEMAGVVAGIAEHVGGLEVWIEVDVDGTRAGVPPDSPDLVAISTVLGRAPGVAVSGVLTHGGGAYLCRSPTELGDFSAGERAGIVEAAERVRGAGVPCPGVSMGSTPSVVAARSLEDVTEVRPGVYMFQDLFQAGMGLCSIDDIAVSVLSSVIGRRPDGLVIDAGALALSLDRSTARLVGASRLPGDVGFGLVCDEGGRLVDGWRVERVTQEHGVVVSSGDPPQAPIGTRLRVLPNHACLTAAGHAGYQVVSEGRVEGWWPRCTGW